MGQIDATVHQVYGTHCTYATSALERLRGEQNDEVVGYSARAGSLEKEALTRLYSELSHLLYYYLPADAPLGTQSGYTWDTSPPRLFYYADEGKPQVLGLVSFRETDMSTPPRPESYFGHLLCSRDGRRWDVLDCLKAWGAPGWRRRDGREIPFLLPSFASFAAAQIAMLQGEQLPDYDAVLENLLELPPTPSGQIANHACSPRAAPQPPSGKQGQQVALPPFAQAVAVSPESATGKVLAYPELSALPRELRRNIFRAALRGFLAVVAGQHQVLLLVAEPQVAVLVIYLVARLLPSSVREQLTFSTYENSPQHVFTRIAAIGFHQPESDLPETVYRDEFVVNTRTGKCSQAATEPSAYLTLIWDQILINQGWRSALQVVDACQAAGFHKGPDLEQAARAEQIAQELVNPHAVGEDADWQGTSVETYVRCRTQQLLDEAEEEVILALGASPRHRRALLKLSVPASTQPRGAESEPWPPPPNSTLPAEKPYLRLLHMLDRQDVLWYLNLNGQPPVFLQAALQRCADTVEPGEIVRFLSDPDLPTAYAPKLSELLNHKLPPEQLDPYLLLPFVPLELKTETIGRLAAQFPPERMLEFLQNTRLPSNLRLQALEGFLRCLSPSEHLQVLQLPLVPLDRKRELVAAQAARFTSQEALTLLNLPDIPAECRDEALKRDDFLERFQPQHVLPLLRLEIAPSFKQRVLKRLAAQMDPEDLQTLLSDEEISEDIKHTAIVGQGQTVPLEDSQLRKLLLSPAVSVDCKCKILEDRRWTDRLCASSKSTLLLDERLPDRCKETACRSAAWLEAIPCSDILSLLTTQRFPTVHREDLFETAAANNRFTTKGLFDLLRNANLPEACKQIALTRSELLELLSDHNLAELLQSRGLPPAVVRAALEEPAVRQRIPGDCLLPLLQLSPDRATPAGKNALALEASQRLPTSAVLPALKIDDIDDQTKLQLLGVHAEQLKGEQLLELLDAPQIPESCKKKVVDMELLVKRVADCQPVGLLDDSLVPLACRRAIAAHLDLEALPPRQALRALELPVEVLPCADKKRLLDRIAPRLTCPFVEELLTSRRIEDCLKERALQSPEVLEQILPKRVPALLLQKNVPHTCGELLVERFRPDWTLEDLARFLKCGRVSDETKQQAVQCFLDKQPQRVVPLLQQGIAEVFSTWTLQKFGKKIPEHDFSDLLCVPGINSKYKVAALYAFFEQFQRLPETCTALWTEEMQKVRSVGIMAQLLRRVSAARVQALLASPRQQDKQDSSPSSEQIPDEIVDLSLYVSLFCALAAKNDPDKAQILKERTKQLIDQQKEGFYAHTSPTGLHRILECLQRHGVKSVADKELNDSLGDIAICVLESLCEIFQKQPSIAESRLELLNQPFLRSVFNEDHQGQLEAWKTIVDKIRELGIQAQNRRPDIKTGRESLQPLLRRAFSDWAVPLAGAEHDPRLDALGPFAAQFKVFL